MSKQLLPHLESELHLLQNSGLYKHERALVTPQSAHIQAISQGQSKPYLNLCANNYLGLADHPKLIEAAKRALESEGLGMASVRFICGTHRLHQTLEQKLAQFLHTEDSILYASCFDANGGLFESLLGPEDVVLSDALNHASIIDGIRLCKATRVRYLHSDMDDLRFHLEEHQASRFRLIVTDGVFSMDGDIAKLGQIIELAREYDALVMVDDSHATGFVGETGRGVGEYFHLLGQVDIYSGTFGKALGGGVGGYIAAAKPIVDWLRQRSRPYLFSNALSPMLVASTLAALEIVDSPEGADRRSRIRRHSHRFREGLSQMGYHLLAGDHAIIPVMLTDAKVASALALALEQEGVYVSAFSYPVVPMDQARIRTQMSAALSDEDVDQALAAFEKAGHRLGVI